MGRIIYRELLVKLRSPSQSVFPIVCYILILLLFPLAMGAQSAVLIKISGAAIWISALLSVLLGLDTLFKQDLDDGVIEQIIVSDFPLALWVLIKSAVHWMAGGLVLSVLSIVSVPLFGLTWQDVGVVMGALLAGTPALCMIGAMAAVFTVALPNQTVLITLVALPLQLPILVFGAGVLNQFHQGVDVFPVLAMLCAISLLSLLLLPFAMAAVLKMALVD